VILNKQEIFAERKEVIADKRKLFYPERRQVILNKQKLDCAVR
jgi:hypothetical protein